LRWRRTCEQRSPAEAIGYDPPVFELRRDPITGWWSAIVVDRSFEHASFAVEAAPVEGTHCRHCDEDPAGPDADDATVRRVTLRQDAFHRIDSSKDSAAQLSMSEVESSGGSWEILVGPRDHHERLADASPRLALNLLRALRDAMRQLGADADPPATPISVQAVQSYGRQAGSRSQHLNMELYAIPQVPHRLAEEIGGAARYQIKNRVCVWCGLARSEEESGERLVLAEERFVVFAPAASRSAFELMIVPRAHAADFTALDDDDLAATAATLQRTLGGLSALGDPPYNLFLHTAPAGERLEQTFHWHWELHPRLRVIAGLEGATALAVNPAAPEYAAEFLRAHLQRTA
jgi:UDPglucose--hexose-1-phosphate uridylyltransferase